MSSGVKGPRSYRTSIRRGDAPEAVMTAARQLFAAHGYQATSIEDIAREAGVARPTVYASVGTKAEIFTALLEAAITGGVQGEDPEDQEWFRTTLQAPTAREVIASQAHDVADIGGRVVDLYRAAELGSGADPAIAEVYARAESGRRRAAGVVASELKRRPEVCPAWPVTEIADLLAAVLSPWSYRSLVLDSGWAPAKWERWVARTLAHTLLHDEPGHEC